jgi:hypothetical protein
MTTQTPLNPWLKASVPALVVALAVGAGAAAVRTDASDGITFAVFGALTFPFVLALGAMLLDTTEHPEQHDDSIERQWTTRASSGAFFDTVTAMGLTVFATSVLDTRGAPLWIFVLLALGDFAVRLVVLSRREA